MPPRKRQGNNNNKRDGQGGQDRQGQQQGQAEPNLTESERLPLQKLISDFVAGAEQELILPNLSNAHRKYLHRYAARMGLKTRSHGNKSTRVLHITRLNPLASLGDARRLELTAASRHVLTEMLPTLRSQLVAANKLLQRPLTQQQKQSRLRGEALSLSLGPRMVPPRPNRISNELYRDKQELPIYRYQDELHQMLKQHSIFIVNGETGSGKTTQVPQFILSEATRRNRPCRIVVTQPRRVAATSVAMRVAEERGEQVGETVGYQIRMESRLRKTTNLIYTTSGCLLRSIMADVNDLFRKVSHLIIDEIHERDKYTDFTLITIKEQLKRNKDLKVILMSATMDIQLLSKYFDDCAVLNVPGQGYDVKIYHLEDILYHTGYRTALMEKYLRSMDQLQPLPPQAQLPLPTIEQLNVKTTPVRLNDEYLQEMLDTSLNQCLAGDRSQEELCEIFDQIQYYVESESMPVDAGHSSLGATPLIAACKCNCPKYVQLFLQHQANAYVRDTDGFSAMEYAAEHADGVCTRLLESSGAMLLQYQLQLQVGQEECERQRILTAYQKQFNDDNEVDHDLILSLLEGLYRSTHPGAIMVFLPGYNDIVAQRDLINSTLPTGTYRICILHGQMDSQDQFEALQRQRVRKIILSTNIGQTSITVPDLAYIIDSGKVKMKTYDSITESSQLQAVWISRADANQRSGRAGRVQNGVCYRLYSLAKYRHMPQFGCPEFMRIPLTEICLYAKTLDPTCNVNTYLARALNPPSPISIQNAVRKLQTLQVFQNDETVTDLGRQLVELPLDVQLGKCLLYGIFLKCVDSVLTIVAFHSVKDPFILPTVRTMQGHASFQRKSFAANSYSDQMGILSLYKAYSAVRYNRRRQRDFCAKYFLSQSGMEMFCATRCQIADLVAHKFRPGHQATLFNDDWNMVRLCLVAGFYPNVAAVDRTKNSLISGAEKQLILQRTSALNPPGMKNLKDFIHELPDDWVVFYEKSRLASMCSINMNTLVPSVVVVLQCGRNCALERGGVDADTESNASGDDANGTDEYANDDDSDANGEVDADDGLSEQRLAQMFTNLSLGDESCALMSLDNWIRFIVPTCDAKMLMLLRQLVRTQFHAFLRHGQTPQTTTAAFCVQKLLQSINDPLHRNAG